MLARQDMGDSLIRKPMNKRASLSRHWLRGINSVCICIMLSNQAHEVMGHSWLVVEGMEVEGWGWWVFKFDFPTTLQQPESIKIKQ